MAKGYVTRRRVLIYVALVSCAVAFSFNQHTHSRELTWIEDQYPFQNPDLPIEERIDNLLSLMTIDEKIGALIRIQVFHVWV